MHTYTIKNNCFLNIPTNIFVIDLRDISVEKYNAKRYNGNHGHLDCKWGQSLMTRRIAILILISMLLALVLTTCAKPASWQGALFKYPATAQVRPDGVAEILIIDMS